VTWINIRYGWRALFWAGFLALLAALLDFLPLFNVLGYDFSFALGLATALAGVDIGHGTVRVARASLRTESVPRLAGEAIVTTLAALVAPLLISLANALRVRNCNLGAGLTFFALLPVGTAIYAAGVGVAVGLVVPVAWRLGRCLSFPLRGRSFASIATQPSSPSIRLAATFQDRFTTKPCAHRCASSGIAWRTSRGSRRSWPP
jgi:hypothetical protein